MRYRYHYCYYRTVNLFDGIPNEKYRLHVSPGLWYVQYQGMG